MLDYSIQYSVIHFNMNKCRPTCSLHEYCTVDTALYINEYYISYTGQTKQSKLTYDMLIVVNIEIKILSEFCYDKVLLKKVASKMCP